MTNDELDAVLRRLEAQAYRLTPQRRMILQAFRENPEKHLSAEDVLAIVKSSPAARGGEIGLATVYRTLDLLADLGILQRLDFGDGRSRYEMNENGAQHHHHHLICVRCGKVAEFGEDLLEELEGKVRERTGFWVTDHQVKFYGLCPVCRDQEKRVKKAPTP